MEKLLFKKGRKSPGRSFLNNFIPLFAPFRYAPLLKEGNENCKQYLGLKLKCKFETGLTSEKCKLFLGRVISLYRNIYSKNGLKLVLSIIKDGFQQQPELPRVE